MTETEGPTDTEAPVDTEPPTDTEAPVDTETPTDAETPTETGMGEETPTETGTGGSQLERAEGDVPEGLEVSNVQFESTGEESGNVTGTVENTGNKSYEDLEVAVTLLDDDNGILDQFFNNTEDAEVEGPFDPGDTWDFTVDFDDADIGEATRYRVDLDADVDHDIDIDFDAETETATSS